MKFALHADVDSVLQLPDNVHVAIGDYDLYLLAGPGKMMVRLTIDCDAPDYAMYQATITGTTVAVPTNPYLEDIRELLKYIESVGSIILGLRKIDWEGASFEWSPEPGDDTRGVAIGKFRLRHYYERSPAAFSPPLLRKLVDARTQNDYLTIPMSFMREGLNDFYDMKHIRAFFNFYFFLEHLFANGTWRSGDVEREFMASSMINAALATYIAKVSQADHERHLRNITPYLAARQLQLVPSDLVKLIVRTRGQLHHTARGSTQLQGHPLNERDFEPIAYLALVIVMEIQGKLFNGATPA